MNLFAEKNFFWPNITNDIKSLRENCWSCNENAPSMSKLPPQPQDDPTYPFEKICVDYCSYAGKRYGVAVDRYSNFPIVWRADTQSCSDWLHDFCMLFGVPEEMSPDGGPEFMSGRMQQL